MLKFELVQTDSPSIKIVRRLKISDFYVAKALYKARANFKSLL